MAIKVQREPKEPFNAFLRRYSQKLRRSGVPRKYKQSQYFKSDLSKNMQKRDTLERKDKRENAYYKRKTKK